MINYSLELSNSYVPVIAAYFSKTNQTIQVAVLAEQKREEIADARFMPTRKKFSLL